MGDPKELIDGLFNSMFGEEEPATQSDTVGAPILTASTSYYSQADEEQETEQEAAPEQEPISWDAADGEHPDTVRCLESHNKSILELAEALTYAQRKIFELEDKLDSAESHVASLVKRQSEVNNLIKGLRELFHAAL